MSVDDKANEDGKIECIGVLMDNSGHTGRLQDMGKYKISGNSGEIEAKICEMAKRMGYKPQDVVKYEIVVKPKKR